MSQQRPERELVAEVRVYCREHADPGGAQKYARYFKEGYDAWGMLDAKHPFFNAKQDAWFEKYRRLGLRGFLTVGELLFESGKYEEGALAIRFVKALRDDFTPVLFKRLERWFTHINNWAHTDVLCGEVISALLRSQQIDLNALAKWRFAAARFERRAVPVAMLGMLKDDVPVASLLSFVEPMMMDSERVVHQGLGWFLREAWKKEPRPVEGLLTHFREDAARLIYQYATEKMTPAQKQAFKRRGT